MDRGEGLPSSHSLNRDRCVCKGSPSSQRQLEFPVVSIGVLSRAASLSHMGSAVATCMVIMPMFIAKELWATDRSGRFFGFDAAEKSLQSPWKYHCMPLLVQISSSPCSVSFVSSR